MESTPAAPSLKIPASQGEAQKTVIHYIQQTVDALPPGTNVDGTRYAGTGSGMAYCEDEPRDDNSPVNYAYWGDLNLPPGTDVNAMYGQVESIWKGWGWQVLERQGFEKPNRFGYAPDGYVVQIKAAYPPGSPPTIIGTSPCFPGNLRKEGAPIPTAINQTSPAR